MSNEESKYPSTLPIKFDKKTGLPLWSDVREFSVKYNISINNIQKFFEGLSENKIFATKCKRCGKVYFPPQVDCPACKESDIEWIELSGEGELETFTIIKIKPKTFQHYDDYMLAVGKLKEGIKVLAWLKTDSPDKVKIGMKIKLVVTKRLP